MRFIAVALVGSLAVGCVTQEGISLASPDCRVQQIVEQRESRKKSENQTVGDVPTDLVVVGTASAFRPLTSKNSKSIYGKYFEYSKQVHPDTPPAYSEDEFGNAVAGWTRLKVFTIPLVMGNYECALVPNEMRAEIGFPSGFETFLVQGTRDLLAARTNEDGYFFVRKVLCKDETGYSACAKNYRKGLFDGSTGQELEGKKLVPKHSGRRIDPISYEATQK